MYSIQGDASYNHTVIYRNGKLVNWKEFEFRINRDECIAIVDSICGNIDRMILSSIYLIISGGEFVSSKIIVNDEPLRGVQSVYGKITENDHPVLTITTIMLPNIVEDKNA